MMKSNELRTGNLVFGPLGEIMKIVLIDDTCEPCYLYAHCINGSGHGQNGFEHIPITEEWLLKFGFTKISEHTDGFFLNVNGCKIAGLKLDGDSIKLWLNMFGTSIVNDIIYVHRLQNLNFALTQKELEYDTSK